jgi:hypothetical protein
MNYLLRPRMWASFLASSCVGPYNVPLRYASEPIPRYRGTVARWHAHLRGLATATHEISGLRVLTGNASILIVSMEILENINFYPKPAVPLLGKSYPFMVRQEMGNLLKLPAARPVDETCRRAQVVSLRSSRCRESSKCKVLRPFYCSSLAHPSPLLRTGGCAR